MSRTRLGSAKSHTVTTSVWLDESTGRPTRKTYWSATCDQCGEFISAAVTRDTASIDTRARTSAAYHSLICSTE